MATNSDAASSGAPPSPFEPLLGEGADAYAVKLSIFEGPLDLLLHLIRLNEVDVTDIPIARIGEQYLEYLEILRELNLDIAAEYLVMAATLAWIKSRMLLPPDGLVDEDEGPDPRAELVARLLEYQRFKEAAGGLDGRPLLGRDVFEARGPEPEPVPDAEAPLAVELFQLVEALRGVLARARAQGIAHEVFVETITVRERMIAVMDLLQGAASIEFLDLFRGADGGVPTRSMIVATFLAVLELARLSAVRIYQGVAETGVPEGPIRLRPAGGEGGEWNERISELM